MIEDIAVQFATIFVGAYLAFAAEDLRQRRETREWAKTHLRQLSSLFAGETQTSHEATDLLDRQLDALDAWLAARTPEEVSETQWEAIVNVVSARGPDLSPVLRGEPVALLPADLALALSAVEGAGRELETHYESIRALRERIIGPWSERKAPLGDADRRIVALYRSAVVDYRTLIERAVASVRSAVEHIDSWAGAPQ